MQKDDLVNRSVAGAEAALFLQRIKKDTSEQHILLESQSLLSAIMKPGVTPRQYGCYLILMKKIAEAYETNILTRLEIMFPARKQKKPSLLIEEDLQSIGGDLINKVKINGYTLPGQIVIPFALGFMYVMEGSKLGGKVIFKHIHRTLGFSENRGAKYIADYGSNTIVLWKEFLATLSRYVVHKGYEDAAIQGARYAFTSIYNFFESNRLVYEV